MDVYFAKGFQIDCVVTTYICDHTTIQFTLIGHYNILCKRITDVVLHDGIYV